MIFPAAVTSLGGQTFFPKVPDVFASAMVVKN